MNDEWFIQLFIFFRILSKYGEIIIVQYKIILKCISNEF